MATMLLFIRFCRIFLFLHFFVSVKSFIQAPSYRSLNAPGNPNYRTSRVEAIPQIDEWSISKSGEVVGVVKNHPILDDGDNIITSSIMNKDAASEKSIVVTSSGSKYKLLRQKDNELSIPAAETNFDLNGRTIGTGRYLLSGKKNRSTSGKSQIWSAYKANSEGTPTGDRLIIKLSTNFEALKRENENYNKISSGLFSGQFVKKVDFLPQAADAGFEKQSALVMQAGIQNLKTLIEERWGRGMQTKSLRDAAAAAGQCIQAMHSSRMVWTDLKTENFVLLADVDGEQGLKGNLRGVDLESAVRAGTNPVDYSPEACPPEFARAFVQGDGGDFEVDPSYDMWSLGMMLFEMSTGRPYFKAKSAAAITSTLKSPAFEPDVAEIKNAKLRNLVEQCLKLNPKKRPTITQFLLHPYFITSGFGPLSF